MIIFKVSCVIEINHSKWMATSRADGQLRGSGDRHRRIKRQ